MKPYSKDLILKVVAAVDRDMLRKEVARGMEVSTATMSRAFKKLGLPLEKSRSRS